MLGGKDIPGGLPDAVRGIIVNSKADAPFLLQTARIHAPRNEREIRDKNQYEMARYVVHYADGKTETIPVYAEIKWGTITRKRLWLAFRARPSPGHFPIPARARLQWPIRCSGTIRIPMSLSQTSI